MTTLRRALLCAGALVLLTLFEAPAASARDGSDEHRGWKKWDHCAVTKAEGRPWWKEFRTHWRKKMRRARRHLRYAGLPATDFLDGAKVHPSSIPILDPDFLPGPDMAAWTYDPATWTRIHGPEAHTQAQGRGVVVAVVDCGFNLNAPLLQNRLHPTPWDAIDRDGDPNDLGNGEDDDGDGMIDECVGHGTFVASAVLLAAPEAIILPIRAGTDEGLITEPWLVSGIRRARHLGAHVINLSMHAAKVDSDAVRMEIEAAEMAGITVVVAAGNDGMPYLPFVYGSLVVGSVDGEDVEAEFTNVARGDGDSEPFVYAPGVDLHLALGREYDASVAWWSGTSFSAGLVSGGVALLLERAPFMAVPEIVDAVTSAVEPVWRKNSQEHARAGRINLQLLVGR